MLWLTSPLVVEPLFVTCLGGYQPQVENLLLLVLNTFPDTRMKLQNTGRIFYLRVSRLKLSLETVEI